MGNSGQTAIKAIVAIGLLTTLFLWFAAIALKQSIVTPHSNERVILSLKRSTFQARRAYEDLEAIVAMGARPAGSPAALELREFLKQSLSESGFTPIDYPFTVDTPHGPVQCVTLVARVQGDRPGALLYGTPYDTIEAPGPGFAGVNNGGAGTAWMLEMARTLGPEREGRSVWLVWYDGRETPNEGQGFVNLLLAQDPAPTFEAAVNLERIGDCHLRIGHDADAAPWLREIVWDLAQKLTYGPHFAQGGPETPEARPSLEILDVPSLDTVDFPYGGSIARHHEIWQTPGDTLEEVCTESLQAVGDVLYHALTYIDEGLDAAGSAAPK